MRIWIAIWQGSSAITQAICDWIRGGVALRLIVIVVVAGFCKGLPVTTYIAWTTALAWLVIAICLGLRMPDPTAAKKPAAGETSKQEQGAAAATEDGDAEQVDEDRAQPSRDTVIKALHGLLKESGGVHLQDLAKALPGGPWKTGDARSLLTSHSIRIRAGVRVPGVGGREGVHRDDIPPLPSSTEEPTTDGDVAAGQGNNNNGNNADDSAIEIVQDDANPQRWHVLTRRVRAAASSSGDRQGA